MCNRHGISIDQKLFKRLVARVAAESPGPNPPPPGALAALAQEVKAERAAASARLAAVEAALVRGSGNGFSLAPDEDAPRLVRQVWVPLSAGGGSLAPFHVRVAHVLPVEIGASPRHGVANVLADVDRLVSRSADAADSALAAAAARFDEELEGLLSAQDERWEKASFLVHLGRRIRKAFDGRIVHAENAVASFEDSVSRALDKTLTVHAEVLARVRFQRASGYDDYLSLFPVARSLGRRLVLFVGPTNSGKTYHALEVAAAAPTARVLSPLRLLALEHYETLAARGLAAAMVTGEETLGDPDATHVAQTIETMSTTRVVDVAVVDEVQMLVDPDRGWAWTEAIVGVPGRTVVMTGSVDTVEMVARIAAMTGEPLEIHKLVRKNPLHALPSAVLLDELKEGDALVAFSRREVFALREEVTKRGLTVASVYGALSPDVRRSEARRFRDGEAQVLVATDAIGMGLNIGTLRRVIFSATDKFDGTASRLLTGSEYRQIAGRAGRYGFAHAGYAGVLDGLSPKHLVNALATNPPPLDRTKLYVKPTLTALALAREHFGDLPYHELLDKTAPLLTRGSELLELGDIADMREVARLVSGLAFPLEVAFQYSIAPVERRSNDAMTTLKTWAGLHAAGRPVVAPEIESYFLDRLEHDAKMAVLYLWLGRRFPETYSDREAALDCRGRVDVLIEAELVESSRAKVVTKGRGRGRRG